MTQGRFAKGVDRRAVLALAGAAPLTSACGEKENANTPHIAVIGAGIVGASIAYHLAKSGAQVTVLERGEIAGRASHGTFAWINATWAKQPRHYHRLNQLGLARWQELESELNIPIKWNGSVEWFADSARQERLVRDIAEQVEWGEPARMVTGAGMQELEPEVAFGETPSIAFSPTDGALDPVLAAQMLIDAARELGAAVETKCEVKAVRGETVLETSKGDIEVDRFVLATGADPKATMALAQLELPQRSTPGVIVVTKPQTPLLNRILVAPGVHIHQRLDGRVVLGEQDGAPDTQAHAERLKDRPTRFPSEEFANQHAQRIIDVAERYLPGIKDAEIEEVVIGWRPLPLDGHPVLGPSPAQPNAYIAITHSGVTLAPIIGKLAAQELLEGIALDTLTHYRADRRFEEVKRY